MKEQENYRESFDFNIALIGFMGVGKSTVAAGLSRMFGMKTVEMDQAIAERERMSIPEIFETYGEEYFRERETELLMELECEKSTVISCGGGVPLRECNVDRMKKNGYVVLLTASPEVILSRVSLGNDRPVLKGRKNAGAIAQLMEERRERYEKAADIVIDTDGKDVLQICAELAQKLKSIKRVKNNV